MAKVRSGYIFQDKIWFGAVSYVDGGKRQKVKRRAKGEANAQTVAERILLDLNNQGKNTANARLSTFTELGEWYARVTFTDEGGQRRNLKRRAASKTLAKELVKQLLRDIDDEGSTVLEGKQITFAQLADYFESRHLIPAQYVDGRKVAGLRSLKSPRLFLKTLRDYFGKRKLRSITRGDLEKFKADRLSTPLTRAGKKRTQRSIAAVNRELALLSKMFTVAQAEGWIIRIPFKGSTSLISHADERKRERIITREEEARLLSVCASKKTDLRPLIVCALDTGMRKSELLKLQWFDIDFDNRIITVRAFNTKTMRERKIAMTERLTEELRKLYEVTWTSTDALVFGFSRVDKAFNRARLKAGIPDLRFHDLRHTHATRLVGSHIPLSEVGRMLGHTQANTTYRYVNANVETARRAAAALNQNA